MRQLQYFLAFRLSPYRLFACALRAHKFPEVFPNIVAFALVDEGRPFRGDIDSIFQVAITHFWTGLTHRQKFYRIISQCFTPCIERTSMAIRCRWHAMQGAQLHNRRVEQSWMLSVQQLLCQLPKMFLALGGIKRYFAVIQSRQHTIHIAVYQVFQ